MALLKFEDNRVDPLIVDGYTYRTCQIGNQLWCAENLIVPLTGYSINPQFFRNNPDNLYGFGRYYNWEQAMSIEAKLPRGWRIPTKEDFVELYNFCGGTDASVLKKLRSTSGWTYADQNGTDDYGFTLNAYGGQYWESGYSGSFVNANICSVLWSKTEASESSMWVFYNQRNGVCRVMTWNQGPNTGYTECNRFSVRCVATVKMKRGT